MADTTAPPRNDLYETDFYEWTQEQARLLRNGAGTTSTWRT